MKRYLVDTPLLAAYLYNRRAPVELVTPWITHNEAATSILVYGEVVTTGSDFERVSDLKVLLLPRRSLEIR